MRYQQLLQAAWALGFSHCSLKPNANKHFAGFKIIRHSQITLRNSPQILIPCGLQPSLQK